MKKVIIALTVATVLIASSFIYTSCSDAKANMVKTDSVNTELADEMESLGFTNTNNVLDNKKRKIKEKYNLNFISDSEMDTLLKKSGFVLRPSAEYIGEIPASEAKRILKNFKRVSSEQRYYFDRGFWPIGFAGSEDKGIFVVAPVQYFTKGSDLNKYRDPIVIVKIEMGWIEIAKWL